MIRFLHLSISGNEDKPKSEISEISKS
ncbi:unknown protein [Simkania negevensis Z]|uniref:Uncharacterized protein n=1 Tax=Simkania negevensis (strain ATCC VR-1471 / DSM 27360 / Z) TaxID=331113 RepID=F8L3E3_SIMNZ|nr:unknown protein [Simkania negevensis Z]